MERRSDKHGPLMDEELEDEVRSLTQGAPVESRAQERRELEGPAEREPVPDSRIAGERGLPRDDSAPGYDEVEQRSDLARYLEGAISPADRDEVVASARRMQAPDELVDRLARLPRRTYTHTEAVWDALRGGEA